MLFGTTIKRGGYDILEDNRFSSFSVYISMFQVVRGVIGVSTTNAALRVDGEYSIETERVLGVFVRMVPGNQDHALMGNVSILFIFLSFYLLFTFDS